VKDWVLRKGLDRAVLAVYLAALIIFMAVPVSSSDYLWFLNIGAGKWAHFGVFCGLAALFCWNFADIRYPSLGAAGASAAIAILTEAAQGAISYRSASWPDLLADAAGIIVGVAVMTRIMSRPQPGRVAGVIVTGLGLGVAALFLAADLIGFGDAQQFGPAQVSGAVLGILVAAGGLGIYALGRAPG
jgi:VanZ family protein